MEEAVAAKEQADVAFLTGAEVGEVLAAALDAEGSELHDWHLHTIHHRPGAGVTAGYTVSTSLSINGEEYLCVTTGRVPSEPGPGLVRVADGERQLHVWRHPADPALPALATACEPETLATRLGVSTPPRVELLAYRPLRRAVVRAQSSELPDGEVYVKVVRPKTVDTLAARHTMLTEAGVPSPRCLASHDDGMVVLGAGHGASLATLLARGMDASQRRDVLDNILTVLERIPAAATELTSRPAWAERAGHYAHAASVVLPGQTRRIMKLAAEVRRGLIVTEAGPIVPSHGDLYEANLLMNGNEVATLLDVDATGPGRRVDDLACLLAHVSVLRCLAPETYPQVPEILHDWMGVCDTLVDPAALRVRAAGVVLSLIAGARRGAGDTWRQDAECRLAQAEAWLAASGVEGK